MPSPSISEERKKFLEEVLKNIFEGTKFITWMVLFGLVSPGASLPVPAGCVASDDVTRDMIAFHYYSLACFLISGFIVVTLRIKLAKGNTPITTFYFGIGLAVMCFVGGFVSLLFAHVDIIQLRLGLFPCTIPGVSIIFMLLFCGCVTIFLFITVVYDTVLT